MKVHFLGTGTSTGNPEIGCRCRVCTSKDPKDNRLRTSALFEIEGKRILIDCGPDFRQQIMKLKFAQIDGVLITHEHYDHVGGLDDLRPFCKFDDINVYAENYVASAIRKRIPYCFIPNKYPGIPVINLFEIDLTPFKISNIQVTPIRVMHHNLPIMGYRIGNTAYLTDLKYIPEEEFDKLKNLDTLIIDALRIKEHLSHESLAEALKNIERIAPRKAYLIHMSHDMGLHEEIEKILPSNVYLPYDGLEIETN